MKGTGTLDTPSIVQPVCEKREEGLPSQKWKRNRFEGGCEDLALGLHSAQIACKSSS